MKKELGFKDKYFEDKINYLLGYTNKVDDKISQSSILEFHLAHKTNPNFSFEPNELTNKLIWRYLSSSNLLFSIDTKIRSITNLISFYDLSYHPKTIKNNPNILTSKESDQEKIKTLMDIDQKIEIFKQNDFDYVWIMHGLCVDYTWIMHGICMVYAWIVYGVRMDYA